MLEFAAADFHSISSTLTQLQAQRGLFLLTPDGNKEFSEKMASLRQHAERLKMRSTLKQIGYLAQYIQEGGKAQAEIARMLEELQKRIQEDLESRIFLTIATDKADFFGRDWLQESDIAHSFSMTALPEMLKAGRCYAYDEDTACVFHLMRAIDFGLRVVAKSLGISYDARNWMGIANEIQKNMEQKYALKTADWKKSEPMYAGILTDIQAISRGHRNPVLHELEKQYGEKEAHYLLVVTEAFLSHLAKSGLSESTL